MQFANMGCVKQVLLIMVRCEMISTRTAMTTLWMTLAVIVGSGMFVLKYEVQDLEVELASLDGDIRQNQETIHVLKAEWSHLNNPERLRVLSAKHIGLTQVKPEQVVSFASLNDKNSGDAKTGVALASAPIDATKEMQNKLRTFVSATKN